MAYTNFWKGWEQDVLRAARVPVTPQNVTFLADWHRYELSAANNNPLNVTGYPPEPVTVGVGAINSAGVQSYATPSQGAGATAAFFHMSNFASIFAALKSGDPFKYAGSSQARASSVGGEIAKWGTPNYAAVFLYENPSAPVPDTSTTQAHTTPSGGTTTSTNTGKDPLTGWVGDLTGWASNTAGYALTYAALVMFAVVLGIIGLLALLGVHPRTLAARAAIASELAA